MNTSILLTIFLIIGSCSASDKFYSSKYYGSKVIRAEFLRPGDEEVLEKIRNSFDLWRLPKFRGDHTDIFAQNEGIQQLESILEENGISHKIMIPDVGRLIEEQTQQSEMNYKPYMNWEDYQPLDTLHGFLTNLTIDYPSLIRNETIGFSTEGREIIVYKISSNVNSQEANGKPAFWIDGTIHAREWISPATVTYMMNELVTNSKFYMDILNSVDFYFLPMINPDGYVYSFEEDRLWRKTRSFHNSSTGCMGVDCNRNFGFAFGGVGSSEDKCSNTYRGPNAYSEPEAKAVRNYITSKKCEVNWQAFITTHSYSQLWMAPYGYSYEFPENYDELMVLAEQCVDALTAVHGTNYSYGSASHILYRSSGSSRDWAHGEGDFRFVYTIELRDDGSHGFLLPPDQILPTAEETWAGILVVAEHLRNLFK